MLCLSGHVVSDGMLKKRVRKDRLEITIYDTLALSSNSQKEKKLQMKGN